MVERGSEMLIGIKTRLLKGHGSKWKWKCYGLKERSQEMEMELEMQWKS